MSTEKVCQGSDTLIFACSGAADVGAIADQAARQLTRDGAGQMFCLAGIGGGVEPILNKTQSAQRLLVIDGCGLDCVKKTLAAAGFNNVQQLRLTDLGLEKGQSQPSPERIEKVTTQAKTMLS